MKDRLQHLLDEGLIDEVFQQLQTGKEAEVWMVSHRGQTVAAKLYKERDQRNFKNNAGYLEGRSVRNSRTQRAMDRGTSFGRKAAEAAWKSSEADALFALHAAGVRVPKPVLFYEGVLLMEVIGDAEGRVAPRLVEAGLTKEQALPLYLHLRGEVVKMLAADLIHGDLSEFNVLLGVSGPVIIDFPQVVAAAKNSRAEHFFRRDLGNLLRFFSGLDPDVAKHGGDAAEIWRAYTRRELSPDFVPTGRAGEPRRQSPGVRDGGGRPNDGGRGPRSDGRADQRGPRGSGANSDQRGPRDGRSQSQHAEPRSPDGRADQRGPRNGANSEQSGPRDGRNRSGRPDQRGPRGNGANSDQRGPRDGRSQSQPAEPRSHDDQRGPRGNGANSEQRGPRDGRGQSQPAEPRSHDGRPDQRGPRGNGGNSDQRGPRAPNGRADQARGNDARSDQRGPRDAGRRHPSDARGSSPRQLDERNDSPRVTRGPEVVHRPRPAGAPPPRPSGPKKSG